MTTVVTGPYQKYFKVEVTAETGKFNYYKASSLNTIILLNKNETS